jgi:hypothetical protein
LRSRAESLKRTVEPAWKSLKLLEEVLLGQGVDEADIHEIIEPLKELNYLRSKISGHASGTEATQIKARVLREHRAYPTHFRQLCQQCDVAIRRLRDLL